MKITREQHNKALKEFNIEVVEKSHIEGLIKENSLLIEKSTQENLSDVEDMRTKEIAAELNSIMKSVVMDENESSIEKGLQYEDVYTIETQVEKVEDMITKSIDGEDVEEKIEKSIYSNTEMNRALDRVGEEVAEKE